MKIKIRLATEDDIDRLVYLANEWHPIKKEIEHKIRVDTLRETLNKEGHKIFVAENEERKIVGWFDVRTYKDWFMLRFSVHVEHIYVYPTYQNQGIGSLIMDEIKKYCSEMAEKTDMNIIFIYSEGIVDRFFTKNGFYISPQHFYICKKYIKREPLGVD